MTGMSGSAEEVFGGLSDDKAKLLELLLEQKARRAQKILRVARNERERNFRFPASWAQQRLWFIDKLEGGTAAYNVAMALRISGPLHEESLRSALHALAMRHEPMRTTFESDGGDPMQIISREAHIPFGSSDLSHLGKSAQEQKIQELKAQEVNAEFDLQTGPLVRAQLLRLTDNDHMLLMTMHHIISDGWSIGVLFRELSALYDPIQLGKSSVLKPLEIQYADYAQWQRKWSQGDEFEAQMRYWRRQLQGLSPQLDLPTDRPRPAAQSFRGENAGILIDPALTAQIKTFARKHEATLFMTLYAAWPILLSRLSGREDVAIGTPVANRRRPEVEGLIGFFVNSLVLRANVRPDVTVAEFLSHIKEVTLGAYDHQDMPFEKIVEDLQPERNLSRNPLFQVSFALQNSPRETLRMSDLTATLEEVIDEPAIFDLTVSVEERGDGISGSVNYATDILDRRTVNRWIACWKMLLSRMTATPMACVRDLDMLPPDERQSVTVAFNATTVDFSENRFIHQRFEEQAARAPGTTAVIYEGRSMSFAELNEDSNRLAHRLRELGISPDQRVGILLERSPEMIVAVLGVLKAGGAYVPMDSRHPADRLSFILKDAAPRVLLTQKRLASRIPDSGIETIELDGAWRTAEPLHACNIDPAQVGLHRDNLAYVIYTSGSTGKPKGVMIEHSGLSNYLEWALHAYRPEEGDAAIVSSPLAFDATITSLYCPLLSGRRVVLVPDGQEVDGLERLLEQNTRWSLIKISPAHLQVLGERLKSAGRRPDVGLFVIGGEALSPSTVSLWQSFAPAVRLINEYGPTETVVGCSIYEVPPKWAASSNVPIGSPIANTRIYILDPYRQPSPIGVPGEIYIAGAGVARGYLNRHQLTSERFVADPFSSDLAARMYRSGDMGRWRPDGTIEYLGRNDDQIKIRGFRIELGEIEAQLTSHFAVKEATVIAREDVPGEKRLVAYVVGDRSAALKVVTDGDSDALRSEMVGDWRTLYDGTYGTGTAALRPSFVGWDSSYTGGPIAETQMQEWLDSTVARILDLRPKRVLEIGCGVGLLLHKIAPHCDSYVGVDFSASAIESIRQWTRNRAEFGNVELLQRTAVELDDLSAGSFDTIVINSVIQYFPDVDYFLRMLRSAVRLLRPNGCIFVGDVRHLGTLEAFQSAVQLGKATATLGAEQLRKRIARRISEEKELLINPRLFDLLPGRVPGIASVDVQLKRGRGQNELIRHRYDVVIRTAAGSDKQPVFNTINWNSVGDLREIETMLRERRCPALQLTHIPNARLAPELAGLKLVKTAQEGVEAGELRSQLVSLGREAVEPEVFWELGESLSLNVRVTWNPDDPVGAFDVELLDPREAAGLPRVSRVSPEHTKPWTAFTNDPLENSYRQQLIPQLRDYLKERLPEYMIPSAWLALNHLPLTANGKVDRRALPAPASRPEEVGEYIAPRTDVERALAQVWAQILHVDQVGVNDNFFELGGHSLLIVQMLERLRKVGLVSSVRNVYASATLADLARTITTESTREYIVPGNLIPRRCELITPEMLPLLALQPEHIELITRAVPGGAANIKDIYPLAPLQEGILFHHLLRTDGGDAYARSFLFEIESRDKLDAFIRAIQSVVDRHDILRTAVLWDQLPRAVQVVQRRAFLQAEELEFDPNRGAVEQLEERMNPEHQRLDIRRAPMLHLRVAKDPQSPRLFLLLQTHHLVFDNESMQVMLSEVTACMAGRGHQLPDAVPYRNHVAQSLEYARSNDAEVFFRRKLGDVTEPTAPFGVLDVSGWGGRISLANERLPLSLADRLRAQAKRLNVSAAALFHAVWALVMAMTSGKHDVVFGSVLLGRLQGSAGAQRTLGMFINTLPLRLQLHALTVEDLVRRTQDELAELLDHEQASLAVAQKCSGIPATSPLFTTLLNYMHRSDSDQMEGADTGVELIGGRGGTNYPFLLSVSDEGRGFELEMAADRGIGAQRMIGYVNTTIRSLVDALEEAPCTCALSLPVLTASEKHRVIREFNATRRPYPDRKLIHELFEAQVDWIPDAPAIVYEGRSMSFAALNAKANQLGWFLKSRGVGPNLRVGICVERGMDMIVAILGVLKAGGAYVPMDPMYPPERLTYLATDAQPRVVLIQDTLKERLSGCGAALISIDGDWDEISKSPTHNLNHSEDGLQSSDLAYVIYTSGSTGQPKGVMVEHRNVVSLWQGLEAIYRESGPCDRIAMNASFSFDSSVKQWVQLLSGRTLYPVPQEVRWDAGRLINFISDNAIGAIDCTPSQLSTWISAGLFESTPRTLRAVLVGGEAIEARMWRMLADHSGVCFYNLYGPTESTVDCTFAKIGGSDARPHLGRPMENREVYILNEALEPVPIRAAGELYLGGAGIARGYLNRAELTKERFVPDPFSGESGARLYRTGDLGRWQADGTIEFLGRNDSQTKIRGFRVELGEIEAQLSRHPEVSKAVVCKRNDENTGESLVAYVATANSDFNVDVLRQELKGQLPHYMVPSAIVLLESIPLTPNGKVDYRALPAPDVNAYEHQTYEPPVGSTEQALAEIWGAFLGRERIGRHDNFFELGGHSLYAMQLIARLSARFDCRLSVIAVFRHPTIREMAAAVKGLSLRPESLPGCEEDQMEEGAI